MPKIVKVKSGSRFEELHGYSRIVAVDDWILMSNTAGRNYAENYMPDDAAGQARQAFANVSGSLEAVGSSLADVVRVNVTIPDEADVDEVMEVFGEHFRGIDPAFTVTLSPLAGAYKVELEVTAHRGVAAAAQEPITIALS